MNPVEICIHPNPVQNRLFRIAPGMTGFCITAKIVVPIAAAFIDAPVLDLHEVPNLYFELLARPSGSRLYDFPRGLFSIPEETVLNHKFPGTPGRGQAWDDFSLGTALQRLPDKLHGPLAAQLNLLDGSGEIVGSEPLKMPIERKEYGLRLTSTTRSSLFELEDDDEEWSAGLI